MLFNVASAYTTKRGLDLIFQDQHGFGAIVPWLLSIGCAAFLVFLTFEVAARKRGERIFDVAIAYCMIAAFSIFCNFSFIYSSLSGKRLALLHFQGVVSTGSEEIISGRDCLRKYFNLPVLEQQLSDLRTKRDFEKKRIDRPGEGNRWLKLDEQVADMEGKLQLQTQRYNAAQAPLSALQNALDRRESGDAEKARQDTWELLSKMRQLSSQLEVYGFKPQIDFDKLDEENDSASIAYNLRSLFSEIGLFLEGSLDRLAAFRFILSMFLSVVLDTALFVVVAVRRPKGQGFSGGGAGTDLPLTKRIWDERLW